MAAANCQILVHGDDDADVRDCGRVGHDFDFGCSFYTSPYDKFVCCTVN